MWGFDSPLTATAIVFHTLPVEEARWRGARNSTFKGNLAGKRKCENAGVSVKRAEIFAQVNEMRGQVCRQQ